jgi:hypothetical protein
MRTREIYELMQSAIEEAVTQKSQDLVKAAAQRFGFQVIETRAPNYEATYFDTTFVIKLEYRTYDPSGPFQSIPDINKFSLRLYEQTEKFERDYSD